MVQLSAASGKLLERCDGTRSIREIAADDELEAEFDGIPAEKGCWLGYELLRQQGLVVGKPIADGRVIAFESGGIAATQSP